MLIVVRHGSTKSNEGEDYMRGWDPIPLSQKGMKESYKTADTLKDLNIPIDKFYTSSLPRAIQTSEEIKEAIGDDYEPTDKLRTWNVGDFVGEPVDECLGEIHKFIDNANEKVPGGESYKTFYNRVVPFLKNLVESEDNHLIVTHNCVINLIKALSSSEGKHADKTILKRDGPMEPGGIMAVNSDWSTRIIDGAKRHRMYA